MGEWGRVERRRGERKEMEKTPPPHPPLTQATPRDDDEGYEQTELPTVSLPQIDATHSHFTCNMCL